MTGIRPSGRHRRYGSSRPHAVLAIVIAVVAGLGLATIAFWPQRPVVGAAAGRSGAHGPRPRPSTGPIAADQVLDAGADPGLPGPGNTGWQHTHVTLRPVDCGPTGEYLVLNDGAVLDGLLINCPLRIYANNVTVRRSRVSADVPWAIYKPDGYTGLTVTDVEVAGQPGCEVGLAFSNYTATRLNVHGCLDGVRLEDGSVLQDSWIHDFWDGTDHGAVIDAPEHDGVLATGGTNLTIRHNRIDNPHTASSCVRIGGSSADASNIVIADNYLDGGTYSIYLDANGTNRVISGNTFTHAYLTGPARVGGSFEWTGNVYPDGSAVQG